MSNVIRANELAISFGTERILDGVSLTVGSGEAVAVVGANGAGKTTLLKILAGVLGADRGSMELLGDDITSLSRREIARRMAVVPQGAPQVFNYELIEFVLMGYYARDDRFLPSNHQMEGATAALKTLNLEALARRPVSHLSGGEMQRALMARALVASAPLWLLDEPTASLDMCHQIELLQLVRSHVDEGGTAVAILHDLALVHRFFDRVVVLDQGQFLTDGPPNEVLTSTTVSKMYGVSMQRGNVAGKIVWVAE